MNKTISAVLAAALMLGASLAQAEDPESKTVAQVLQEKQALAGHLVQVKGKVVKVNNGIMKRNFVHVEDGTSADGTAKVIATSTQTAKVGDSVIVAGKVVLDRDFGGGYSYPLLLEESTITPAN